MLLYKPAILPNLPASMPRRRFLMRRLLRFAAVYRTQDLSHPILRAGIPDIIHLRAVLDIDRFKIFQIRFQKYITFFKTCLTYRLSSAVRRYKLRFPITLRRG